MNKELQKKLDNLSQIKLSEDAKKRGFDILMQKVADREVNLSQYKTDRTSDLSFINIFKLKFVYIAAVVLLIFIGGGYVQSQIDNSLPDNDSLYTVKRALEKAQVTLSFNSEKKAQVMVKFLDKRAKEINKILEKPDKNVAKKVGKAIKTTKDDVESIKKYLDKKDNSEIQDKAREKALEFQIVLENIVEKLPEEVEDEIKKEIEALNKELGSIIEERDDNSNKQESNEKQSPEGEDVQDENGDFDVVTSKPTTTTSTLPADLDLEKDNEEKSTSTSDETGIGEQEDDQEQEEFSVEKDTFEVYIGK